MRFAFIAKHRHIWPVSWLCEMLEVSRSGFHDWLNRPTSAREIHNATLVTVVATGFKTSDRTYGARRVWHDVLEEVACGLHRIERLMRVNALCARPRRRGTPKDDGERSVIADNILERDFRADRPNQKWLTDVTYIWTAEGWLYVAVVLDLFSRRIVGWSMKTERMARKVYRTRNEARADVFAYIERFYNPRRRHSKLGYPSPMQFEARALLA